MADTMHAPRGGPDHWAWRCVRCDQPVYDHPSLWARLAIRRAARKRARTGSPS